jgi:hypothetical protein
MKQIIAIAGAIFFTLMVGTVWVAVPIAGAIIGSLLPIIIGIYIIYHMIMEHFKS